MSDIALYRKYRPQNFDNLVGQEHVRTTLINAIKTDNIAHAYLFTGPRGTGKTSSARLIAKALNCTNLKDGFEPCDECEFCVDINDGRLIDLIEIDAASNRGIDEVRDLKEKISFAPTRSKYKIHIIDEAHMMTKEAFNALLKTLEEPPSHAYFVLATTEIHKIPETIISRCQRFDFRRISDQDITERLAHIAKAEGVKAEDTALELIGHYVDGGMRDAIGLLEQLTVDKTIKFDHVKEILGLSDHGFLEELFGALCQKKTAEAIKLVHKLHDQGSDLKQFTHEFVDFLRQKMLSGVFNNKQDQMSNLVKMIEIFQDAQLKIGASSIPQLPLEIAIVRLGGNVKKIEELEAKPVAEKKVVKPVVKEEPVTAEKVEAKVEPKVEPTPAPVEAEKVVEEEVVEEVGDVNLTLEQLQEKWPRVTERIKSPALRMSLKSAKPVKLDGANVLLEFGTQFHSNKVMEHDSRVELEETMKEFLRAAVKIKTVVKQIEIKPVVEEDYVIPEPASFEKDEEPQKTPEDLSQALEIFGGEVV